MEGLLIFGFLKSDGFITIQVHKVVPHLTLRRMPICDETAPSSGTGRKRQFLLEWSIFPITNWRRLDESTLDKWTGPLNQEFTLISFFRGRISPLCRRRARYELRKQDISEYHPCNVSIEVSWDRTLEWFCTSTRSIVSRYSHRIIFVTLNYLSASARFLFRRRTSITITLQRQ